MRCRSLGSPAAAWPLLALGAVILFNAVGVSANTPGRGWIPVTQVSSPSPYLLHQARLETNSAGLPVMFGRSVSPGPSDVFRYAWEDTSWNNDLILGRRSNFLWPVVAPDASSYILGEDVPSGNWFYLTQLNGTNKTTENITQAFGGNRFGYAAAIASQRRWLVVGDFNGSGIDRALYSDQLNQWTEVPITGVDGGGMAIGALDDTSALVVWAGNEGVRWGQLTGPAWTAGQTALLDGNAGALSGHPRIRLRPSGGLWCGWSTKEPYVTVTSFRNGAWEPLRNLTCNYRSQVSPEMRYSDAFDLSRDQSEYPAVAWAAFDGSAGVDVVCVSVPTDTGWTVADQLENDVEGYLPSVARDSNGDVWVAFGRGNSFGVWWTHTYTRAVASTPIVPESSGNRTVAWVLSELAPETWWAVLRSQDGGDFQPVARARAGNTTQMSWVDTEPPGGTLRYRIRRECVDKRYEWLSDPSDLPVSAVAPLFRVDVAAGQVTLSWYAASDPGLVSVQRRTERTDWVELGTLTWTGNGIFRYVDGGLETGRYAYRLSMNSEFSSEAWVDVPGALAFALEGFKPNPAAGVFGVGFTLAGNLPACLEVYSVAGKRVFTRDVGAMGPGNHFIDLSKADLRAGVYWVRITQAGQVITRRGVVTQ